MFRRFGSRFLALTLGVMVLAGCGGAAEQSKRTASPSNPAPVSAPDTAKKSTYPITLKDGAGREVTIPAEPKRIISVAPSNTELVFALGRGSSLVGRSDFCDYPPEAQSIASIGGILKPNYEQILNLKPDLILFIGGSEPVRDQLTQTHHLNLFVVDPQNFAALYESIKTLGVVLNAQEQADKVVADMQKAAREIADKVAGAAIHPKVFYEVWDDPLMTAGAGTFIDDLIKMAGGVNGGGDVQGWSEYSVEKLQSSNPDVIITGSPDLATKAKAQKGWEAIKAVKESKIYAIEDENLIVRPGPRLVLGLKWLAQKLHPDTFQ